MLNKKKICMYRSGENKQCVQRSSIGDGKKKQSWFYWNWAHLYFIQFPELIKNYCTPWFSDCWKWSLIITTSFKNLNLLTQQFERPTGP